MEHYHKHLFFVDSGVTIAIVREINTLQRRFGFSEDMRKLLLIQVQPRAENPFVGLSHELIVPQIQWYTLDGLEDSWDIIERNEDCILSDYLFVFAQDYEGNQYAEITKGQRKGQIVWLDASFYADVDSLEEFMEEQSEHVGFSPRWSEEELIFNFVSTESQLVEIKANSLELFLC
ncbi:SMI1/KNR4 family protein [Myroides sp. DW712]|uniref:SMI1/KNR4 family protein n=1 Tax=Myroides sp. DW712 TaxID=3389800 RepID=UPI00397D72CD